MKELIRILLQLLQSLQDHDYSTTHPDIPEHHDRGSHAPGMVFVIHKPLRPYRGAAWRKPLFSGDMWWSFCPGPDDESSALA